MNYLIYWKKYLKIFINKFNFYYIKPFNDDYYYQSYSIESKKNKLFLNLGAGKFKHKYWTNIDYSSSKYKHLQQNQFVNIDFQNEEKLPYENNSIELIYCSHVIEHFNNEKILHLFEECHRVLKPNGSIRIVVPDADFYYRLLQFDNIEIFESLLLAKFRKKYGLTASKIKLEDYFLHEIATELVSYARQGNYDFNSTFFQEKFNSLNKNDFFDKIISMCNYDYNCPSNHINWWNKKKLKSFLNYARFKRVFSLSKNKSFSLPFKNNQIFDKTAPEISLFIEAIK